MDLGRFLLFTTVLRLNSAISSDDFDTKLIPLLSAVVNKQLDDRNLEQDPCYSCQIYSST